MRCRLLANRVATASSRARRAVAEAIGPDEIQLWLGLLLVAAGFWWVWKPGACLVPGSILIWTSLPTRAPFVARRPAAAEDHRKGGR